MAKPGISRRTFLRWLALSGIGSGLLLIRYNTREVGLGNFLRWVLRAQWRRFQPATLVALGACPNYEADILNYLRDLWQQAKMPDIRGKRILLKANMLDVIPGHPVTTDTGVVTALVDLLWELGAIEVRVGDGSAFRRDTRSVAEAVGLIAQLEARNTEFVDLNYDNSRPVPVKDGWLKRSPNLWLPESVIDADYVVSAPKMKTHHWSGVTLSLKNLFGVIPGSRYGWPKNMLHINSIQASILATYSVLPPVLAVVDGIVGMEGDGPLFGTPVEHGVLVVSSDPIAADVVCTGLMGFNYEDIPHLSIAAWAGLWKSAHIETVGTDPATLTRNYLPPPNIQ
jgi:uncharacterized protein (DUF362 family)